MHGESFSLAFFKYTFSEWRVRGILVLWTFPPRCFCLPVVLSFLCDIDTTRAEVGSFSDDPSFFCFFLHQGYLLILYKVSTWQEDFLQWDRIVEIVESSVQFVELYLTLFACLLKSHLSMKGLLMFAEWNHRELHFARPFR